jgi:hypothetical protein
MSHSDLADEVRRLRTELDEVKQLLRESDRGLSRPTRATWAAIDADDGTVRSDSESDSESDSDAGSVSRRHALHTAGVIVAGALAGGIATVATAGPAAAASGVFDGAPAVSATSASGTAVYAQAGSSGNALTARSPQGDAVNANSTAGYGIYSVGGIAGGQFVGRYGVIANGTDADIAINPAGNPPPSFSTAQYAGSIKLDSSCVLWLCVESGTPGVWQQIGGLGVAGAYHAVTPSRVYDSRLSTYPLNGVLSSGQNRTISVANSYNTTSGARVTSNFVPAGATAVFANVGVVNTVGEGWLAVNPGGVTAVSASTVNWSAAGQILANGVALTLNDSRQLTAVNGSPGSTNFFIDITGYWL